MYAKTKFRALTAFAILFLTAVILLLASDMRADAGVYSGDGCGVNGGEISWSVDTQTGVLTISGTGEMAEYSEKNEKAPWRSYRAYITSVVIEEGITNIGSYAFYTMYKIESISVPETVMRIGQYAFNGCSHLLEINIPKNIKFIGESAFYGTGYYYDTSYWEKDCVLYVDGALIMTRHELDASYTVREGTKVIAVGAFSGHSELTKVTLPESVNGIGHYAFRGCSNMAEINLPQGLTEIGYKAFYRCSSLTEITVPDSVTEIGEGAFGECLSLKSITLPFVGKAEHVDMYGGVENVTEYHPFGYVFAGTSYGDRNDVKWHNVISQRSYISGLQDPWGGSGYVVPPSLKNVTVTGGVIFPGAFNNCTRVKRIVLGDGVSEIGDWAFRNCSSLDELIIGKNVKSIGNDVFSGCEYSIKIDISDAGVWCGMKVTEPFSFSALYMNGEPLIDLVIPEGVTVIESNVFRSCASIRSVTLPKSLERIGTEAFKACYGITTVNIPSVKDWFEITFEGGGNPLVLGADMYVNGKRLTKLIVPHDVTVIPEGLFRGCEGITSVIIHNGVTEIGDYAFYECFDLQTVNIGSGLTTVGGMAFAHCVSLSSVVFEDSGEWWITDSADDITLLSSRKLSKPDIAAEYLKEDYVDFIWKHGNVPMGLVLEPWISFGIAFTFVAVLLLLTWVVKRSEKRSEKESENRSK